MGSKLDDPCYQTIGIDGDRTCPELDRFGHCRHCPMFAMHGRKLFEQEIPEIYLRERQTDLAQPVERPAPGSFSIVVFRVKNEWLALRTAVLERILGLGPIHHLPHRTNRVFRGIVNVSGELLLAVSLADLFGLVDTEAPAAGKASARGRPATPRLVVIHGASGRFALPVDEVLGVFAPAPHEMHEAPATLSRAPVAVTRQVCHVAGHEVGLLEEAKLFPALERSVGA